VLLARTQSPVKLCCS